MYKIQTFNNVSKVGLDVFDENKYSISDNMENPDAILVRSKPIHDVQFGDNLKAVIRIGAGVNTIPVDKLTNMGVCVFNCPGGNANAVKELTIAAIIMLMRNGIKAMNWVASLSEEESASGNNVVEKGKEQFRGPELMGKTIGIIGVGAVGSRMAKACHDLGLRVIGYDPYLSHLRVNELSSCCKFTSDMDELLQSSDIVTVHAPLNQETEGFIGEKQIQEMKDGAYLVNYARGPIVDNEAVCRALDSGKLAGYATDFPTPEEMKKEKVFFTPHLASGTPEAEANCSIMAARQTIEYLENGNIANSVNLPDVSFGRADGSRVCVIHQNKVGMLGKMTDIVVGHGLNIENLVNKARGEIAYTIIDFNSDVPMALADAIEGIDGVIRVRVID